MIAWRNAERLEECFQVLHIVRLGEAGWRLVGVAKPALADEHEPVLLRQMGQGEIPDAA